MFCMCFLNTAEELLYFHGSLATGMSLKITTPILNGLPTPILWVELYMKTKWRHVDGEQR